MMEFRNFGHSLIQRAEALCNTLMFGWLPSVDLSQIKDDMSNTTCSYSFLEHPDNDLSTAYLALSTRACTAQGDGLLRGDRWDLKAISEYLKMSEEYQEYIAAMMLTLGGQAIRIIELLGLEFCNGQSTERGVYTYNGFMAFVTRHHKAKKSTNKEFTVVRFLLAKPGKLLFYYLVYIRKVVAMLRRETSGIRDTTGLLFCSPRTPDRPWPSKRLTNVLIRCSSTI